MKVIKIGAAWCNGCIVMKPRWADIEKEHPWLESEFYDYDEHPEVVDMYQVSGTLPVAIVFDDAGNEVARWNGEVAKDEIVQKLTSLRA